MRRLLMIVALVLLFPGVAYAGGGGGDISQCPGFGSGSTVSMLDSCFAGIAHFAPTDNTITVSNDGGLPHTFTAVDGSFDSGTVQPGETYEFSVSKSGIYEVFCSLHGTASGEGMAGVLIVGEAEPLPMAAQFDSGAIRDVIATENEVLAEALDRQILAIGNLSAAQASLRTTLEDVANSSVGASAAPVPVELKSDAWVPLTAGLAAGLALAGLVLRRRELGVIQPRGSEGFAVPTES
ncbi:MAG: hypothetical protein WD274_10450 [Acidimicrobiia bacterium]